MTRAITTAVAILMATAVFHICGESRLEFSTGHETARCTYLSPATYTGPGYGLEYEWIKTERESERYMKAHADVEYGYLLNHPGNSRMYDIAVDINWGIGKCWRPTERLILTGGGTAGIDGGAMYLPRNGNNPAQAQMWAGASLSGGAKWEGIKLLGRAVTLSEEIELATIGCFFSPQYGETYYEIYVGNHSGLVHFGWWGNRPQIKSRLRADWQLGRHALTLGFDYRFQGLESCHTTTRRAVCSAVIGIRF